MNWPSKGGVQGVAEAVATGRTHITYLSENKACKMDECGSWGTQDGRSLGLSLEEMMPTHSTHVYAHIYAHVYTHVCKQAFGMEYVHKKRVQHRDLKSLNIPLQTEAGAVCVDMCTDMCIAKYIDMCIDIYISSRSHRTTAL